jgi:hypothetical protein
MQPGQNTGTAWTARIEDYVYLRGADRASWAWEFLRRNPDYRHDFEIVKDRLPVPEMSDIGIAVTRLTGKFELPERWGLVFFREPKSRGGGGRSLLARRCKSLRRSDADEMRRGRGDRQGAVRSSHIRLHEDRVANAELH